jgi:hypothetical protein
MQLEKGNYFLYNLNNALQHCRRHHQGVKLPFSGAACTRKYRSKHAALCHAPKCAGPVAEVKKSETCDICKMAFSTKRGLSQHERIRHPAERNEKRASSETKWQTTRPCKGFGKVWMKEEIDTMLWIESSQLDRRDLVQQMAKQLPNKTLKQIRDKRREPMYKSRLRQHNKDAIHGTNTEQIEIIAPSSDSEPKRNAATARFPISETEEDTDEEEALQRQNQTPRTSTGTSPPLSTAHETTKTTETVLPTVDNPPSDQETTTDK